MTDGLTIPAEAHPWGDPDARGLRTFPRDGAPLPGDAVAVAALDRDGIRHLAVAPAPGGGPRSWISVSSANRRDLVVAAGELPGAGRPFPADALAAVAASGQGAGAEAGFAGLAAAWAAWDGEAGLLRDGFLAACGPATASVRAQGEPASWLVALDRLAGHEAVEATLARLPLLAPVLGRLATALGQEDVRALARPLLDPGAGPDAIVAALAAVDARDRFLGPRRDPAALRRLVLACEGLWMPGRLSRGLLRSAGMFPAAWMPRDAAEAARLVRVVRLAERFAAKASGRHWRRVADAAAGGADMDAPAPAGCRPVTVATLLAPLRGDWARAESAVEAAAPGALAEPDRFCEDARDMARALARQVLGPAMERAGLDADPATELRAWSLLFGGKGLPACARAVADWHGRGHAATQAIAGLSAAAPRRWPRRIPDHRAPDGRLVTELVTFEDLCREGAELCHCVATYAEGCARGEHAILAVRAPDGAPSSTAQVGPDLAPVQHRASRNGPPDPADAEALEACLAAAMSGRLRASRLALGPWWAARRASRALVQALGGRSWLLRHPYDPRAPGTVEAALALWARYLPRARRTPASVVGADAPA